MIRLLCYEGVTDEILGKWGELIESERKKERKVEKDIHINQLVC